MCIHAIRKRIQAHVGRLAFCSRRTLELTGLDVYMYQRETSDALLALPFAYNQMPCGLSAISLRGDPGLVNRRTH